MSLALRETLEKAIETETKDVTPEDIKPDEPIEMAEDEGEQSEPVEVKDGDGQPDDNGEGGEKLEEESSGVTEKPVTESPLAKAPASWKGQAKEVWAALPEQARKEVIRREKQINQTLQESAEARHTYGALQQIAQKHGEKFQQWNANPVQVLEQFMDADRNLSSGPMETRAAYMARLIKEYDIDIVALDGALSGAVQGKPSTLDMEARIQQLVDQRLAPFQQRIQADEQAQTQKIASTIQAMEQNPEYPYFDEVREEMADLIEINMSRGVVVTLDDAYNRIVGYRGYAQPQTRAQNTQRALNASVSVGGSPSTVVNSGNPQDLRGTILSALEGGRR
jgi:hypothetical protein